VNDPFSATLALKKCWSEMSGIDFDIYVDKFAYESWLDVLQGLVMAKEKDSW